MNRRVLIKVFPLISAIFSISLIFASCSTSGNSSVSFRLSKEDIIGKVEDSTRTGKIYRDLDTILVADVFWNSAELNKELVEELKRIGRLDDKEYDRRMKSIEKTDEKFVEFIAACYTSDVDWNDFQNMNSIWSVRLVGNDGKLVEPYDIDKVAMKNIKDRHLFPFITPWRVIYRIQFVRNENLAGLDEYDMKIFSTMGNAKFLWKTTDAERLKSAYTKKITLDKKADKEEEKEQGISVDRGTRLDGDDRSRRKKNRIRKGLF